MLSRANRANHVIEWRAPSLDRPPFQVVRRLACRNRSRTSSRDMSAALRETVAFGSGLNGLKTELSK